MMKKSQTVTANSEITPEANSRMIKLIEQTGIRGIVPDVVKAIISPLINLIANRDSDDTGSALNKSITLIAASDPKNQLELMLKSANIVAAPTRAGTVLEFWFMAWSTRETEQMNQSRQVARKSDLFWHV